MFEIVALRNLAIILIFSILMGTSAFDKLKSLSVPDWFLKQFKATALGKFPKAIHVSYWFIAYFEASLTVLFISSLFMPGILPFALVAALFLFSVLLLGLRMISDFQGSANMFIYFSATLISLFLLTA